MKNMAALHFIQYIAEMVLSDFLKNHYIDNDKISGFTVIEPSKTSLAQGLQYLESFLKVLKYQHMNIGNFLHLQG